LKELPDKERTTGVADEGGFSDSDYSEEEVGRAAPFEAEIAALRHRAFLEREAGENERLVEEFDAELEELFGLVRPRESREMEQPPDGDDPPGWPDL
jgi:hypothetical protein